MVGLAQLELKLGEYERGTSKSQEHGSMEVSIGIGGVKTVVGSVDWRF